MVFPITRIFSANSYFKAFMLNAIIGAIITSLTIELRIILENKTSSYYGFWSSIYQSSKLNEFHKLSISLIAAFIMSIFTYNIFYVLFLYGGGQLSNVNLTSEKMSLTNLFKTRSV